MRKLSLGLVALFAFVAAIGAPTAQAAQCSFNYEQPFYAWADTGWYGLAPGANFENGGKAPVGWSLSGGASVKSGGNPYRPWSNTYSLALPAGASATTSSFCVDSESPYSRMFAYTTTPNPAYLAALKVELIYTDAATRKTVTKQVATLGQNLTWNPTSTFPLVGGSVTPRWDVNGQATVKYKFTALYSTAWRIDDLFIDPKRR